jgi:hypothetical protein
MATQGIHGFADDEAKQALLQQFLSTGVPQDGTSSTSVIGVLAGLPHQAEASVFSHWAAQPDADGARTRWFEALFRWCFSADDADGDGSSGSAVVVVAADEQKRATAEMALMFVAKEAGAAPGGAGGAAGAGGGGGELVLNSNRFHVLKRLIGCSARLGEQGVGFLERYLQSTSQRFRRSYVQSMCGARTLSNGRLFELQSTLPLRTRKAIFMTVVANHREFRVPFIERVLTEDETLSRAMGTQYVTKASSEFVKGYLDRADFRFDDWHLHGDLCVSCPCPSAIFACCGSASTSARRGDCGKHVRTSATACRQ